MINCPDFDRQFIFNQNQIELLRYFFRKVYVKSFQTFQYLSASKKKTTLNGVRILNFYKLPQEFENRCVSEKRSF